MIDQVTFRVDLPLETAGRVWLIRGRRRTVSLLGQEDENNVNFVSNDVEIVYTYRQPNCNRDCCWGAFP